MKFITEIRPAHYIRYLRFNYYHWVDNSAGPRGYHPLSSPCYWHGLL